MSHFKESRAADIRVRRRAGQSYAEIGRAYGISPQRVFQICEAEKIPKPTVFFPHHYRRFFEAVAVWATLTERDATMFEREFPHGTIRGYKRGCSCDDCRRINRERYYLYRPPKGVRTLPQNSHPRRKSYLEGLV